MKLRTAVLTAALGASVLTTVPAMLGAASFAYACDNQTSTCDEDQPPADPGSPGDPGGDPGGGGGEPAAPVEPAPPADPPADPPPPADPVRLEPVVVTGSYDPLPPSPPPPPAPAPDQAGPGDPPSSRVVKTVDGADRTTRRASPCYRNDNSFPFTAGLSIAYTQGLEISSTATASAASILTIGLGLQVNSSVTQTYTYSSEIPPGATFAVYVSYQTNLYTVWTDNGPEEVAATVPVEVSSGPC